MALTKEQIAYSIAQELKDGYYVNLGIGFRRWLRIIFRKESTLFCKARTVIGHRAIPNGR
jgi:acyl CoA:acetate/3-ketoacid CoA transferase beta subunit